MPHERGQIILAGCFLTSFENVAHLLAHFKCLIKGTVFSGRSKSCFLTDLFEGGKPNLPEDNANVPS